MGLHRLKHISTKLIEIGKPSNYPVAVISRGTTKDEQTVVGTLENIWELAKDLPTPALIVVGKVVELREQLNWFEEK
jgi:uroporphyrin-III C-methyltransferase